MKRTLLSILVVGIFLLSACGAPTTAPEAEVPPTPSPAEQPELTPTPAPTPATPTPETESDAEQIEALLREYFAAFSDYDVDRVGALIAEETLNSEGMEILEAVLFAKDINLKMELTAIDIQIDGDTAIAVTTLKTSLGSGDETYKLVREDGSWKIHSKIARITIRNSP